MNITRKLTHSTIKNDYTVEIDTTNDQLKIKLEQKYSMNYWEGQFSLENIKDITFKTGNQLFFQEFVNIMLKALQQKDINSYVDILTSQDLQNLRARRSNQQNSQKKAPSKSNKRYIILTYMANQTKYHYPLSLAAKQGNYDIQILKNIYNQLRVELQSVRTAALNDTQQKIQNSFSIEYEKKNNGKYQARMKEVDQIKSQNQMLKAKLGRLEEQALKKKANIEIQAAIERTKQLKQKLQTANLELVDWKNNVAEQEQTQTDLKSEMVQLHKKICKLLTTDKEITAKKKGQETQKQLHHVKNTIKKNTNQIQKLKKQLEASKARVKQLELKAKKLTSEKNVMQRGSRRGPYSSAGSVRSYGSYNSYGSYGSRRSYGSNNSSTSKPKSNYSYNSHRFR